MTLNCLQKMVANITLYLKARALRDRVGKSVAINVLMV